MFPHLYTKTFCNVRLKMVSALEFHFTYNCISFIVELQRHDHLFYYVIYHKSKVNDVFMFSVFLKMCSFSRLLAVVFLPWSVVKPVGCAFRRFKHTE